MKRITLVLFLLTTLSLSLWAKGKSDPPMMEADPFLMDQMREEDSLAMGPLVEFEGMDMAMTSAAQGTTVLFFHAAWCPSCKAAIRDFEANRSLLEGYTIYITDYDSTKDLQKKYGVTYQHTFVQIDSEGNALAVWNGGGTQEILNNTVLKEM